MSLNADLIRDRCHEIEQSLQRLEKFKAISLEEFLSDQDGLDVACYRLLVAIEAALALCYHVAAKRLRQVPGEYAECFAYLHRAEIISGQLSEQLQQMARFRNLLVHMYWKIDYRRVYKVIQENLEGMVASTSEMAVVGRGFLLAMDRTG